MAPVYEALSSVPKVNTPLHIHEYEPFETRQVVIKQRTQAQSRQHQTR